MNGLLRRTLSSLSYQAIRLRNGEAQGLRILTYHRVTDAHPADRLCVPVARFAQQMRFLRQAGYQTASLAQAVRWIAGAAELPSRAVAITFDDGFEDNFLYAYPELARAGFVACFFVPSAFIASCRQAHHPPEDRPMSWAQLAELLRDHQEIGAHSVTHRRLAELDPAQARWEVRHSKELLEQRLKRPVECFCYPAGSYTAEVAQAVCESGYVAACTVEPGANRPGANPFTLKRTEISAFDSLWDFEKKLAGAYDWLHAAVQQVQRRSSRHRQGLSFAGGS